MNFGLPALIGANKVTGITVEDTATFCTQDLSVFNRTFPPVPIQGVSTFCTQDISVFNRIFGSVPIQGVSTFCTQDISVFNKPGPVINVVAGDNIVGTTEKTSNVTISGTATANIFDGLPIEVEVRDVSYTSTVVSGNWSLSVPVRDVAFWKDVEVITASITGTLPSTNPSVSTRTISVENTVSFWLDASDASTITLSSGSVTVWNDKSIYGFASTISSGTEPSILVASLDGKDGIRFDGINDYIDYGDNLDLGSGAIEIFAVLRINGTYEGSERTIIGKTTNIGTNDRWSLNTFEVASQDVLRTVLLKDTSAITNLNSSRGTVYTVHSVVNNITFQTKLRNATVTGTTDTASSNPSNFNTVYPFRIGASTTGDFVSPVSHASFDLWEVLVFRRGQELSVGQIDTVYGYLAHKWGLQSDLPAGHPYKVTAPTWTPLLTI